MAPVPSAPYGFGGMIRLGDMITRAARMAGDAPALTCGAHALTWRQVETRCWRVARALRDMGTAPGDRVAYLGLNSHRYFECYFLPSRIGAISVPLNIRYAPPELAAVVQDCAPHVLIADRAHWELARQMQQLAGIPHLIFADDGPAPDGAPGYDDLAAGHGPDDGADIDALGSQSDDTFILLYTGGTTGHPKGVMLTHANLFANTQGGIPLYGFKEHEVQMLSGPMFHLGSGSRVFTAAYLLHHTVIVPKFDPAAAMETIQAHGIATVQMVPTMLAMLLEHPDFDRYDLSSVRLVTYGAAVMPQALLARVMEALPGIAFCQGFGMTECSPLVTALTPDQHYVGSATLGTIGRPAPHVDLRIVDDRDRDVPPGTTGEILTRGPHVMKGYWNQPALTARALRGGWYHTGDAAWQDSDGFVHLAGRTVEMIVTGGENVYPVETENALALHPAVAEAAVVGLPDPRWGERVHAVVRLKPGQSASASDLTEFCRARVAGYKLPRSFTFRDTPLPLTHVNKVDKARLKREAAELAITA